MLAVRTVTMAAGMRHPLLMGALRALDQPLPAGLRAARFHRRERPGVSRRQSVPVLRQEIRLERFAQASVAGGGENRVMAEELLHLDQIHSHPDPPVRVRQVQSSEILCAPAVLVSTNSTGRNWLITSTLVCRCEDKFTVVKDPAPASASGRTS